MYLWIVQAGGELQRLFRRKRTSIGFVACLGAEFAALAMFQLESVKHDFHFMIEDAWRVFDNCLTANFGGRVFDKYNSGLTLAYFLVQSIGPGLGALYVALVSGDIVAKEVEDGTMGMLLCRPVSRGALLAQKFFACVVYTFTLAIFIALTSLALGLLCHGCGGLFAQTVHEGILGFYDFGPGLLRYLLALPMAALCLMPIAAMGFMFSCFNLKPGTATILTVSVLVTDSILHNIKQFQSLQRYFLCTSLEAWVKVYLPHVPWRELAERNAYLLALEAACFMIGWAVFARRDLKP